MKNGQVYLDREQCNQFESQYFDMCEIYIRADTLLSSKSPGYDDYHFKILQPFQSQTIKLSRARYDAPGWYTIAE